MDKEKERLSKIFAAMKQNFGSKATFNWAIEGFILFRNELWQLFTEIYYKAKREDWAKAHVPDLKTLAYYIYHIARIEDIVCNTLIGDKQQCFFADSFDARLHSTIMTTGNELNSQQILDFSAQLDVGQLGLYFQNVFVSTNEYVASLSFDDVTSSVAANRSLLLESGCVSSHSDDAWLIDYWCGKTIGGLILMPFTRHLMDHLYNCVEILKTLSRW